VSFLYFTRIYFGLGPVNFASSLAPPITSLLQGPIESNGSRPVTIVHATSTVPAFILAENDRRFSLFRIRNKDIKGTNLDTLIASVTNLGIEDYRPVRSG
jgi:hypothetical protein